jgi:hypothetical protein
MRRGREGQAVARRVEQVVAGWKEQAVAGR